MKCWECKNAVNKAIGVNYLWIGWDTFPISEKRRDVCKECYSKLKFNPNHFVEVKTRRGRGLTIRTAIRRKCSDCKGYGYEQGSGGLCPKCRGTGNNG